MQTEKLYWSDPFLDAFETDGARLATFDGKPSLVLPRTVFYPEAGGQLGDRGTIEERGGRTLIVLDTQIDDAGVIHHILPEAPSDWAEADAQKTFFGQIDGARRASQRAQHTAQHMLSRAILDTSDGATASARLGSASSTIDIQLEKIAEADLARAEDLVNAVIRDDVSVRSFFPTAEELAALPLRRKPKVENNVRVIAVGEAQSVFDFTPCGGTHVVRTGQIGAVRVTGIERYKGMMRITFLAASHALEDARAKDAALGALARDLSCGPFDVAAAIAKLRADLKGEREQGAKLRAEVAALLAERLLANRPPRAGGPFTPIVLVRPDEDATTARALAGALSARADVVAVVASAAGESTALVIQRGEKAAFDCGAWFKKLASEKGGKGGGSPQRAEGRISSPLTLEALENALPVTEA